ncbi:MAG: pentapeptide repeat-containing protein [Cellulomonas sp.]
MAERRGGEAAPPTTSIVRGEDWYARDLSGQEFRNVEFVDLDLTEASGVGAVFEECVFRNAKLNASVHTDAAFINCTFHRSNFFDVRFERCKLIGSMFDGCTFDLTVVEGGNWSFVGLPGADLHSARFTGVRLREADLTGVRAPGGTLRDCDLAGAWLHLADLSGCDLRGSDLAGIDPPTVKLEGAIITLPQAVVIVEAMGLDLRVE